ncbi:MAG: hypothetical protein CME21_16960 [Gemmatimonadetes bacterium]|jgi:hypothetical protein|nr:hypothetical protein [Gemmatimonadota bacterium]HCK09841.1 hypothetical protein [Candidatus Latescibacterota bacterium]
MQFRVGSSGEIWLVAAMDIWSGDLKSRFQSDVCRGGTFLGVLKLLSLDICWARLSHPVTAGIMTYGLS